MEAISLKLELTLGDYKLDVTLTYIFPLYGEGPMWLEIYWLDIYAMAAVLINAEGFIEVIEMDIPENITLVINVREDFIFFTPE